MKRLREEEELERERKKRVKLLKKRKSDSKAEDLKDICNQKLKENNVRWKLRRYDEEKKKKKT